MGQEFKGEFQENEEHIRSTGPPPRLKNRYRLVEWLGEGGMGTLYRAHDEMLGRDVAIKFLAPHRMTNSEASTRFLREARIVARLAHANIMTLYDVDREGPMPTVGSILWWPGGPDRVKQR